ncbi:MAG: hypothetical protein GWN67_02655 [Phycisphaerae bacterium]|nr:hypothetical protein [Phycisphaerae bacterium]NIP52096.1 hypothetical protein [Phycisphaerae bacterium]NIS50061.1 hypothetical protein [Phycisphaerae bacterium]NIU10316.1 hypothetical protein [Phycisphaerae bacterium]NIU55327.1 hypothetical protein [Phycisphaerae bacterium]
MLKKKPEANNARPENWPSEPNKQVSLSGIFVIIICGVYILLAFAFLSGTILTGLIFIGIWSASFLVIYIGMPLACLVWATSMGYRIFIRKNRQLMIWTGIKYGIIVFGIMGLVFGLCGLVPPTAKTFMLGFWIHSKVWLDAEEIRRWIKENQTSTDPNTNVPLAQGPFSLKMIALYSGRLNYDKQNSTITMFQGSGFGHWGLTVAPKGTPIPDGWCVKKLEDGAWVWWDDQY